MKIRRFLKCGDLFKMSTNGHQPLVLYYLGQQVGRFSCHILIYPIINFQLEKWKLIEDARKNSILCRMKKSYALLVPMYSKKYAFCADSKTVSKMHRGLNKIMHFIMRFNYVFFYQNK